MAVLKQVFEFIQLWSGPLGVAIGIVSIVVSVLVSLFGDEFRMLAASGMSLVGLRRNRISGEWIGTYSIGRGRKRERVAEPLKVWVVGKRVLVRVRDRRGFLWRGTIRARAEIRDNRYITGTWYHARNGSSYHGAFQLLVDPSADIIAGRWIGFSKADGKIHCDDWIWTRTS